MASYYSLKNIKINIEFEGKIKSTEIPPYKPISYINEIAMELFNSIKSEIKIFYDNQDISEYKEYIIGDFFKRKKVINIKIEELNPKKLNNLTNNKKSKINKTSLICKCFRDQITNYCRNCKEFICNSCRVNSIHLNHKITQVDIDNLVESVKLYAITLESEIPLNLHKIEENNNKFEKNKKQNDIKSRHEIINEKIDNVLNVYNNYMEHLNDENDDIENTINDYNSGTYKIFSEIEGIKNEINEKFINKKKKIKMNENEFKEYFRILSEKEEPLKVQSYNIIPYCVNDDIKLKMKNMYDKIGEILDLALNSDSPLGVSNEINDLYNFVLLYQNNDEEEENKNNEIEENKNNEIEENNNNDNEEYENNDNIKENNDYNEENENNNKENENYDNDNKENVNLLIEDIENNNIEGLKDVSIQKNEDENSENKLNDVIDKKNLEEKEKINLKQNEIINNNEKVYIENEEIDEQKPL